ncbi:hypothetical protein FRC00_012207 [Tulasnella sp. 408]|nr:hypothetical protein FRC00_012207 [Tulasnella sp. 408]
MPGAVGDAAEGAEEEGEGPDEEEEGVQVPQEVVGVEQPDGKHVTPPNDSDEEDFFTDRRPPGGGGIRAEVDQARPAPAAARQPARPPSGGETLCDCGEPAAERSVTRETANKGRKFWTCETKKCQFFEWVQPEGGASKVIPAKRTRSDKAKCGFFEWDDGPSGSSGAYSSNTGASGSGSSGNKCYKCDEPGHFANECPNGATRARAQASASTGGAGDMVAPMVMVAARVEVVIGQGALETLAASPETASHAGWPVIGRRIVPTRTPNQLEVVLLLDRPSRVAEPEAEVEELGQEVEGSGVILKTLMKTTSVGDAV